MNVAEYQHIVYNEWLPVILGNNFMRLFGLFPLSSGHSFDYDDNFDPRINNEFAAAAFRFGHSLVPKTFLSIEKGRTPKVMNLKEVFFQPKEMKKPGFFDGLLRGLIDEKAKAADSDFVDEIRNHLFEKSDKSGGLDLVALNIQRGKKSHSSFKLSLSFLTSIEVRRRKYLYKVGNCKSADRRKCVITSLFVILFSCLPL